MSRGKVHEYLGATLDFSVKGKFKVRTDDYLEKMIHTFPQKFNITYMAIMLAGNNIFDNDDGNLLGKSQAEYFHAMVVNALFYQSERDPTYSL